MWDLIARGGWLMVPIGACSFFSLAIMLERMFFYFFSTSNRSVTSSIMPKILEAVKKNRITEAINICKAKPFHVTNIVKAGLFRCDAPKEIIKEAMEDASLYEIPKLEKNLNFLGTIAHISPLLGLLGTVVGLVKCFYVIEQKAASVGLVNPSDLAGGIWEALLTTVVGLCVAIPTYIAYNYFVHRVNMAVLDTERGATELLEALSQRRYSGEV
ncbi:MAG: MotA/TolQ/ExbB proton channel family protein [Candidatus Omnitrophica bacterium]|nr:MotA/TolQ/ExbB proton channel family protein [Candidatus Omnitrophota bacterium]